MYSTSCSERDREKCSLDESHQGNNHICIVVSLHKGHTSIPWIQISVEKAYQSNFTLQSSRPNEKGYDKGYISPLALTYKGMVRHSATVGNNWKFYW